MDRDARWGIAIALAQKDEGDFTALGRTMWFGIGSGIGATGGAVVRRATRFGPIYPPPPRVQFVFAKAGERHSSTNNRRPHGGYNHNVGSRTADYFEAVEHLPEGAMLVIPQASWDEYEHLLEDLTGRPGVRVTYDRGRLEIMSPSPEHEEYKDLILRIVHVASEDLGVPLETRGSTTWKRRSDQHGLEPDTCFYIANAHRVVGRRNLDLESDPAPDIAVEIDLTTESLSKLPIYAALGVQEVWRYDGKTTRLYRRTDEGYREVQESQFLRGLTSTILTDVLEASKTRGQTVALATFRQRFRHDAGR